MSPKALLLELGASQRDELTLAWHRLDPWPDTVEGLTRLKRRYAIAPCSNGHIAQSVNLARHAGLPWDAILGAEIARAYKPQPEVYLASVAALGIDPGEAMMVAAHNGDLAAAATAVARRLMTNVNDGWVGGARFRRVSSRWARSQSRRHSSPRGGSDPPPTSRR